MAVTHTMFDIPSPEDCQSEVEIHPTALVDAGAQLGKGVKVGPYSVVGPHVCLHDGVRVGSHVVLENHLAVGERSVIYPFATLGSMPQDLKYAGEETRLIIGKENSIRQYVNMSIGTDGGGGETRVGDSNLFMVNAHVGHDVSVGQSCVIANGVSLAGHVAVGDHVILGGHVAIHQFCQIGAYALAAGGAIITQDVPPYCMVHGNRAVANGINSIGLRRAGFTAEKVKEIKWMYKLVFRDQVPIEDAIETIEAEIPESGHRSEFVDFLKKSERGLCRS